jgi:hypothetical protein
MSEMRYAETTGPGPVGALGKAAEAAHQTKDCGFCFGRRVVCALCSMLCAFLGISGSPLELWRACALLLRSGCW